MNCREYVGMDSKYCKAHQGIVQTRHDLIEQNKRELAQKSTAIKRKISQADYNETKRDATANEFYQSKQWKAVSRAVRIRDYHIDAITHLPAFKSFLIVDHIKPRRVLDRDEWLDMDNLWLLNAENHNRKTALENKMNDNQLKHVSKEWWVKALSR